MNDNQISEESQGLKSEQPIFYAYLVAPLIALLSVASIQKSPIGFFAILGYVVVFFFYCHFISKSCDERFSIHSFMHFLLFPVFGWLGYFFDRASIPDEMGGMVIFVGPAFGAFTALTGAVIVAFADIGRTRKRRLHPICRKCGYNLTGNQSGTCSECGTPIAIVK